MCALCPVPSIGEWAKIVLFMRDQGIDKKPGKGEFNACGMFIFLPIVENLECSEMFKAAAKSSPLGFRYLSRPTFLPQLPPSVKCHLLNSSLAPGLVPDRGYSPCPLQCPVLWNRNRTRGGKVTKNGLLPRTVNFSQRTTLKNKLLSRIWNEKLE